MKSAFFIPVILLSFFGCKGKVTGIESGNYSGKYPTNLNNQWEYSNNISEKYLNFTGLDSSRSTDLPNTIVRITSVNDSLPGYKNLIKMESYDADTPGLISEDWYLNTDSFFSIIAYRDPGASYPIVPKNRGEKFLTIKEFERLSQDFKFNFSINNNSSDTIQYYTYPRIVIKYPLQIGSSWNELKTPFYRDRIVKDITSLQINNKTYQCYVIEAYVQEYKMKMIDYINLKAGLLKREIIADSLAITSPDSPDSITGYAFGHDVSILVSKNF